MKVGEKLVGSRRENNFTFFSVWAPKAKQVEIELDPSGKILPLTPSQNGYFEGRFDSLPLPTRYYYKLDGKQRFPDPASRFQPQGVHGPSEVVSHDYPWTDLQWRPPAYQDLVIYELHPGTFSKEGTFKAIIPHLGYLKDLGITALEIMPVAQFPGRKNWGYDGVYPFAVQNSYGGPDDLKALVNAAHQQCLAVILDVVYNHLGPEGNYLGNFAPYFNQEYKTPWGAAINFDGPYSDEVRNYFLQNALYWKNIFHIDGLRLDAVHAIRDYSAYPFLRELKDLVGNNFYLIAESDLNDPRVIYSPAVGGWGHDGQWADDFHHCLHNLLTGETNGYYADYSNTELFEKVLKTGYAYTGQYSKHRKRRHGLPAQNVSPAQFVVCSQNHDQIGNRFLGERLTALVNVPRLKLAAAATLLCPFTPLLFMGEEYGETAPFQYFADHSDLALVEAVKSGRKEEFSCFDFEGEPPDPFSDEIFNQCVLNHDLRKTGHNAEILDWYKQIIRCRNEFLAKNKSFPAVNRAGRCFLVHYKEGKCMVVLNFEEKPHEIHLPTGDWQTRLASRPLPHKGSKESLEIPPLAAAFFVQEG